MHGPSSHEQQARPTATPRLDTRKSGLAPWERLSPAEVQDCLRQSNSLYTQAYKLTTPTRMLAVVSPLTGVVSSGIPAIDALLAKAVARGYRSSGSTGMGGWVTGSLNEVYGPPMSGKSFLLQRTAQAFIRKQLMIAADIKRQDEKLKASHRGAASEQVAVGASSARANEEPSPSSTHPWDVYICRFDGGSNCVYAMDVEGATAPAVTTTVPSATRAHSTASEMCWARVLSSALDDASAEQRSYARAHVHFVSLTHPNELLSFLAWLAHTLDETATARQRSFDAQRAPRPQNSDGDKSPEPRADARSTAAVSSQGERKQAHSPTPMSPPLSLEHSENPQQQETKPSQSCCHHQALLLVDSLAEVWQHPCLQCSQHAMRWYSSELQRLLRHCLCRRQADTGLHGAHPAASFSLSTTAVVANGCTRFLNAGTPSQQRQTRLRQAQHQQFLLRRSVGPRDSMGLPSFDVAGGDAPRSRAVFHPAWVTPKTSASAAGARSNDGEGQLFPLGDEAWLATPDNRLRLLPAEHSLLSLPATAAAAASADPSRATRRTKRSRSPLIVPVPRSGQPVTRVEVITGLGRGGLQETEPPACCLVLSENGD